MHGGFSTDISTDGTRHILSVADDPGVRSTRQKLLEPKGYDVQSAADGAETLYFCGTHAIDLVLLDYLMAGLKGVTVAKEIKRCKPGMLIVIVSATPVKEKTLTCVDCFIREGEGPALLLEKIRQLLAPLSTAQSANQEATIGDAVAPATRAAGFGGVETDA